MPDGNADLSARQRPQLDSALDTEQASALTEAANWPVNLKVGRFVPPTLLDYATQKPTGVTTPDGGIQLERYDEAEVFLPDGVDVPTGTEMQVSKRGGNVSAIPVVVAALRKAEKEADADSDVEDADSPTRRTEADAFWERYEIPFDYDVAIKGRLSGLTRGSNGNGRDARTVEHLYVKEAFTDGRLSREGDTYLCESDGSSPSFEFTEERHLDESVREYVPKITCTACKELMERWETEAPDT